MSLKYSDKFLMKFDLNPTNKLSLNDHTRDLILSENIIVDFLVRIQDSPNI